MEDEVEESGGEGGRMMWGESSKENEIKGRNESDEREGETQKTKSVI